MRMRSGSWPSDDEDMKWGLGWSGNSEGGFNPGSEAGRGDLTQSAEPRVPFAGSASCAISSLPKSEFGFKRVDQTLWKCEDARTASQRRGMSPGVKFALLHCAR